MVPATSGRSQASSLAILGYTALLGTLTAGILSTVLVFTTTINAGLAVAYSMFALLIAVPLGLAAAFLSLGAGLGLRSVARKASSSDIGPSVAGGIGALATGFAAAAVLTPALGSGAQSIVWIAYAGATLGGVGFLLWSILCVPTSGE